MMLPIFDLYIVHSFQYIWFAGMAGRAIQAKAAKGETKHLDMIKGKGV